VRIGRLFHPKKQPETRHKDRNRHSQSDKIRRSNKKKIASNKALRIAMRKKIDGTGV
jgi:hypothetical protein